MIGPELAHNPKLTIDKVTKGALMDNGAFGSAYNTELHEFVWLSMIHAPLWEGLEIKYEPIMQTTRDIIICILFLCLLNIRWFTHMKIWIQTNKRNFTTKTMHC